MSDPNDIANYLLSNVRTRKSVVRITPSQLAQAFIESRLKGAKTLEDVKAEAIKQLLGRIHDERLEFNELLNTIHLLDDMTSKDFDRWILSTILKERPSNNQQINSSINLLSAIIRNIQS